MEGNLIVLQAQEFFTISMREKPDGERGNSDLN